MAVRLLRRSRGQKRRHMSESNEGLHLSLPSEKSVPSDSLQDYSILLFGRKKIGKTTLAAQFEGALFLMCEPGGKTLSIRQVSVKNWPEFKRYVDLAVKDPQTVTIVIDTTDFAYEYCMEYVCEKLVMVHPSDEAYGKGWKAVRNEFTGVIGKILHSGKGVIFISHSRDEEFKTRHADTYHKTVSSMPGQAKDVLEGLVDIWANYDYDGKNRVLILGGSEEVDAGHRIEGRFRGLNGEPIEKVPMGKSPAEGYRNFVAAFRNLLTNEQVQRKKLRLTIHR